MSVEWKQRVELPMPDGPFGSGCIAPGRLDDAGLPVGLLSPHLYDLVVWGFTERNASGELILRRDIQGRLDGHPVDDCEAADFEGSPLYVGFQCQSCWESAVSLVAYGHHLCPREGKEA